MTPWDGTIPCHPFDAAQVVYVEVPKAACTSIKWALSPVLGGPPDDGDDIHHWTGYTHARDFGELQRWLATRWRGYFKFTVVRDPITRFESFYYDKLSAAERYAMTIDEYVLAHFAADPRRLDIHAIPQTMLIGDGSAFDFVGRVEAIAEVRQVLSDHLGWLVEIPHLNRSPVDREPLGVPAMLHLADVYHDDFVALGYATRAATPA